jgi:hypothetical protein
MFYYVFNIRFILKNVFVIDIFVLIFICFEFLSFFDNLVFRNVLSLLWLIEILLVLVIHIMKHLINFGLFFE